MNYLTEKRKGFPSVYKATYESDWELKNTGYDYSEKLMSNMVSSYMFRNERLRQFIEEHLSPIMVFFINKVKYLRIYYNFAVPKDYEKIN
jgi:hypothetical protein